MGRIMALDVGSVRVGIALSDSLKLISSPHESYVRVNINRDIAYINDIAATFEVELIVVGLPMNMDGSENAQSALTRAFADKLSAAVKVPIAFEDERFTTRLATRVLLEADVSRAGRKKSVDKIAASFILQSYLDKRR